MRETFQAVGDILAIIFLILVAVRIWVYSELLTNLILTCPIIVTIIYVIDKATEENKHHK